MLVIRLTRQGKTKQPFFRVIVSEKSRDLWGTFLENLGSYNPRSKEANFKVDRIKYWMSKGAQLTTTINNLLITKGIIEGKKMKSVAISKRRKEKLAEKKKVEDAKKPS